MGGFSLITVLGKTALYLLGDHDRAVLAASTAEGDGEIAFALADVVRKKKEQKIGDPLKKFFGLRKLIEVADDLPVAAGEMPELGNKMRIGKEAHIEDKIGFEGDAVLEAEADGRNEQALPA